MRDQPCDKIAIRWISPTAERTDLAHISPEMRSCSLLRTRNRRSIHAGGMMDTTMDTLTDIFRHLFEDPDISLSPETTANDVDGWDSLSHMLLITEIENSFSVKFKLKDLNKMRNVGDMIDIIIAKL